MSILSSAPLVNFVGAIPDLFLKVSLGFRSLVLLALCRWCRGIRHRGSTPFLDKGWKLDSIALYENLTPDNYQFFQTVDTGPLARALLCEKLVSNRIEVLGKDFAFSAGFTGFTFLVSLCL